MRREIVFFVAPRPPGTTNKNILARVCGKKSSWLDRRPPKLLFHIFTISGAFRMFDLSHTLLKSLSNIARNSSFLSTENSASKASKRWSHLLEKTLHKALNNSLQIFSRSYLLRCIIKMQGH
jgi:hypothetical protein